MLKYTVVQLVPNQVANECVNVGVIVVDGQDNILCKFLDKWDRVRVFAGNDFLVDELLPLDIKYLTVGDIQSLYSKMNKSDDYSCLRFSEFRGSISDDAVGELDNLAKIFLTQR